MNFSDKAKDILKGIKQLFNEAPAAPFAPAAPVVPIALATKIYKTTEGVEVTIEQAGETPAVGEKATVNGAPAPAGTHTFEDGSSITVDDTGTITACMPAGTPAAPEAPAPEIEMGLKEKCDALEARLMILETELEKLRQPTTQMESVTTRMAAQDDRIKKMVEFFEEIIAQPTAAPATRTVERTKFSEREAKMERLAASIRNFKQEAK